ncbi:MAG: outer membrane lipoprotein carrier protein LolA [Gammaproteobacteria bacterium]|nr:outer membrane lipoprotein carrier protein LolA [Gammaproteobacteria bacterium]
MLKRTSTAAIAACAVASVWVLSPMAHGAAPAAAPAAAAVSQGPTPLDRYLEHLRTLRVTFLQTVADAQGAEVGRSSGTLIVDRPGKFRWEIHPQAGAQGAGSPQGTAVGQGGAASGGQVMVSDGRNLWYYDRDLEQVTVRPVTAALSATPAMLLSGTVDVHQHFTETSAGAREGLDWVYVEPRSTEADFKSALFGFDGKGTLQRMILEDKLGQIVTIIFQDVQVNVAVPDSAVTFTPPQGADVIGTPAK